MFLSGIVLRTRRSLLDVRDITEMYGWITPPHRLCIIDRRDKWILARLEAV